MTEGQGRVDWWIQHFQDEYIYRNGGDCSHMFIPGRTGTGKTSLLYWIVEFIIKICMLGLGSCGKQETIAWFTTYKRNEPLTLLTMWNVRFLYPKGMKLRIELNKDCPYVLHDYELVEMEDPMNPWQYLRQGWVNVVCYKEYIIEPAVYANVFSKVFKKLIILAHDGDVIVPLALIIDELQEVAPAVGHAFNKAHDDAAKWMALNMKMVRELGIRIIGAAHDPYEVRKGVRKEMAWQSPKQGTNYDRWEEPKLAKFNELWSTLNVVHDKAGVVKAILAIIVRPDRRFSDKIEIPVYPKGAEIGQLIPTGVIDDDVIKNLWNKKQKKEKCEVAEELPCDSCHLSHVIGDKYVICKEFKKAFEIGELMANGCTLPREEAGA